MNAPLYTLEILRLAASLPEPAKLVRVDGRGDARSPTCGSTVSTAVQVDSRGRLEALSQTVQACAFGQSSAALVAQHATGRSLDEISTALRQLESWLGGDRAEPPEWPGFDVLRPAFGRKARHPAILLPLRALVGAMESRSE